MPRPLTAIEILYALGGVTRVSRALGVGRSAVSSWPRDGIPARHWPAVLRLANAIGGLDHITLESLEQHTYRSKGARPRRAPGHTALTMQEAS